MPIALNKTKILLVDDDEDDFILFRTVLHKIPKHAYEIEWVSTFEEAQRLIAKDEHDIYIIDYLLGANSGLELLREFDVLQYRQPFIILTGAANNSIENDAMKLGAADYLVKGSFDQELLSRVLSYSLQRKNVEAQRIKQLIEINRSKDEFIAVASHELRTPATAVKQYVAMLIDGYGGELDETQKTFLGRAYDSNERQLQIIDDILRVARLDLQKVTLSAKPTDVTALIRRIVTDYEQTAKKREQSIQIKAPKGAVNVVADETYLRMALANIIDNASKYSHEHTTMKIRIAVKNGAAQISISDEGVGIEYEDMSKLFVKFSRIHNSLSIQRGGTGLGLYWSREIVLLHGGHITVDSQKQKGTTFTVSLPLPTESAAVTSSI